MNFSPLPDEFAQTRNALHQLAEHVLGAARYQREGKIGLRVTEGGFGTPTNHDWQVRIQGDEIIVREDRTERRDTITTLANAAKFVGCDLGAPANVYKPTTSSDPDEHLSVNVESSLRLGEWYAFTYSVLKAFRSGDDASDIQLWPEHFDLAFEAGDEAANKRIGYGGSPGDEHYSEPYLYAVPWKQQPDSELWNAQGFHGHVIAWSELTQQYEPESFALERFQSVNSAVAGSD
jgi:hypothetical protein